MDQTIQLTPLVCVQCSLPIPAEPQEAAWVCAQCGQAMALDSQHGLLPISVAYFGPPPAAAGRPYWVADGKVTLQRSAYKSNSASTREAEQFWSRPRRFFIPAFQMDTQSFITLGAALLEHPPALQSGPVYAFEPVTLAMEDIQPVAEFLVMGVEAARKDAIREVTFTLGLSAPALWILPRS